MSAANDLESARVQRVPNHDGTPRADGDRFLAVPGASIGELRSASTSMNDFVRVRWSFVGVMTGVMLGVMSGLAMRALFVRVLGPIGWYASVLGVPVGWFVATWFAAEVRSSYLGTKGGALMTRPFLFTRKTIVRFDAVHDVDIAVTRVYPGGSYGGTNVKFRWLDEQRRTVCMFEGAFDEYWIDREETDMAMVRRLPPHHTVAFGFALAEAFDEFRAARPQSLVNMNGK